jgi:5-methylcytosine-specific restriction enzyme B
MGTYLLTHNPTCSDPPAPGSTTNWSFGPRRSGLEPGDTVYLMRLGVPPKGMIGRGTALTSIYRAQHWGIEYALANYATIKWNEIIKPTEALELWELRALLPEIYWTPQSSGKIIPAYAAQTLDNLWQKWLAELKAANPKITW